MLFMETNKNQKKEKEKKRNNASINCKDIYGKHSWGCLIETKIDFN